MTDGSGLPVRVFVSYAHEPDDVVHIEQVRQFWLFLRAHGIDARLDLPGVEDRRDWAQWMTREVRDAGFVLVLASPSYRVRADGDAEPDEGRGVQWEARQIRDRFYADQDKGLREILPVLLPGRSEVDIPLWLAPASATSYVVTDFTVAGAEPLLRALTGQSSQLMPPLGPVPVLAARGVSIPAAARAVLRTDVVIQATVDPAGQLTSAVWVAGSLAGRSQGQVPDEVAKVWSALRLPAADAGLRLAEAGRRLGRLLFGEAGQLVADLVFSLPPGDELRVLLCAGSGALALPAELVRLTTTSGAEAGPLGLMPGIAVSRCPAGPGEPGTTRPADSHPPAPQPGPLKILAAVAAPDETKTPNAALDVEAEMQAVLDAVTGIEEHNGAQVRVLEVASLEAIRQALKQDAYHVLHLSAHGSPESIELEDEDGAPDPVTAGDLVRALRYAGHPVPLIVLSSCSGGAGSQAMAASLIAQGAIRVVAMLAPVTDGYATSLARNLYAELAAQPELPVGTALGRARYLADEARRHDQPTRSFAPEFGLVTLLTAGQDGPLTAPAADRQPLTAPTEAPGDESVRNLPLGTLIGRRPQLRATMGVLRRNRRAVERYGYSHGVVLTGIGGIGKTALAGRIVTRLRADGWAIAVHDGRWSPIDLIAATVAAFDEVLPRLAASDAVRMRATRDLLADPATDDPAKLVAIAATLASDRLLVVFDDFEQNLTGGGEAFLDPAFDQLLSGLANAARTGVLLITSRYPIPGPNRHLTAIPLPPLSPAELGRMFLRMPALRDLDPAGQRLVRRVIGGHPRLIELTDALLRGGHANSLHILDKLNALANASGIDPNSDRSADQAIDQALALASADILLDELTSLLTADQVAILTQVSVSRAPMTPDDLAFALALDSLIPTADVGRLTDLTLLAPGPGIVMHPWTAELITRNTTEDLTACHSRALAMRLRRFERQQGDYSDLTEIPRHLAYLGRYGDVADLAEQAVELLPGTLATVAYLAEVGPLIPVEQRAWMVVAFLETDALLRAGDLRSADRQLRTIHQQAQARAAADPGNTEWQRDLSVSHDKIGDVAVAAGDLTTARTAYQAALDIAARLAAADPGNTEWQRDLSVSHDKIGNVAVAAGDLTNARTAYQASLDIAARLAAADPGNTQWQRDLSISHNKIGNVAVAAGDLTDARTAYQASLDIAARLAAADPGNTQWQRDLSISHNKIGNVAVAAGDLTNARTAYQASLDIRVRLAAADPGNTQWQRDLSISHDKIGDIAVAAGDLTNARTAYQAALDIRVRLAAADPGNTEWQRDLSISHDKIGDIAVAAGDLTDARTAYQAALDIAARLAAADPGNTEWQRDLSISHNKIGDIAVAAGDLTNARTAYQAALDIAARLTAADPVNAQAAVLASHIRQRITDLGEAT